MKKNLKKFFRARKKKEGRGNKTRVVSVGNQSLGVSTKNETDKKKVFIHTSTNQKPDRGGGQCQGKSPKTRKGT